VSVTGHRVPRAGDPTYLPSEGVRRVAVDLARATSAMPSRTTPQAVLDHLSDAHYSLIRALEELRRDRDYRGHHRDDTPAGEHVAAFRENAEAIFGGTCTGRRGAR